MLRIASAINWNWEEAPHIFQHSMEQAKAQKEKIDQLAQKKANEDYYEKLKKVDLTPDWKKN